MTSSPAADALVTRCAIPV